MPSRFYTAMLSISRVVPSLAATRMRKGPSLIEEYGSTTVIFAGDQAKISATGEIIIRLKGVQ